jgi:LysM repeat protein
MLFIAQATGFIQIPIIDNMSIFQSRATQTMVPPATQIINQIVVKSTLTPTKTLFPTNAPILQTPTETEPHQLETPFGEKSMFVIHRVTEGESFINLASTYKTTKEAILAINYNLQPVLWANSLIAIPVGITDVSGLPAFTIYTIDKEGITVEGLASSQSIDVNLLQKYNVLPDGYTFKIGEIVLVPHSESAK